MIRKDSILRQMSAKIRLLILFILTLPLCGCEEMCPTIQDYIGRGIGNGPDDCLLCPIFNILIDTAEKVAKDSWRNLSSALIPVVGIVAAIYLAIYTLKLVGSFGKQTANDYLTSDKNGVIFFMFKTAIIVFLLSGGMDSTFMGWLSQIGIGNANSSNFLIDKVISPILKSGLEIGEVLAETSGSGQSFNFYSSDEILSEIKGFLGTPWTSTFEMIRRAIYGFMLATYEPVAVGQAMICNASFDSIFEWYYLMLLYGFILFIFGWLLTLSISFYVIDILIDLMFAAVLLPVGVACAISPKTTGYTKKIWGLFINIFFDFVMLGIILGITMKIVDLCLNRDVTDTGGAIANFMTNYQDHVDANEIKQLSEELWTNGNLLLTIVCLSIATMLIPQIKDLASKISGGTSLSSVGSNTAAEVSKHTLRPAKHLGRETFNRVIKPAGQHIGGKVTKAVQSNRYYKKGAYFATAARGFLTGRGSQGYRAWWR